MTRNTDGSSTMNMGERGTFVQRMDMQAKVIRIDADHLTMDGFADLLTRLLQVGGPGRQGQQVVNMTGLKGSYLVSMEVSIADLMANARAQGMNMPGAPPDGGVGEASDPSGGSTVFASVQKLGLKLEPSKAKVDQLIVDHAEKTPTEN